MPEWARSVIQEAVDQGFDLRVERERRRHRRLVQELVVRALTAAAVLIFDTFFDLAMGGTGSHMVRTVALVGLLLNVPYYFAARRGRFGRAQAYARMLVDVELMTLGLYAAGGLTAAPFLGVYAIVPVYAGLVLSSGAALVATALAMASYLAVALLTSRGAPTTGPWVIVAFNLFLVSLVGVLTAVLAEAYRRSRLHLAEVNRELERANDQSQRLNVELQRSVRLTALGEVLAGIAHELKNVMTVAVGHLDLARKRSDEFSPMVAKHLERVAESCEAATQIVNNTLQAGRESSREKIPLALSEIVRQTLELKGYDLRRDEIIVQVRFTDDFPVVLGAPSQFQQVLLNLVTNAQHALRDHRPPRSIEITGMTAGRHAVLEVRDSGPGIPSDVLPRVFEPFFTTKADGMGLGLAISAAIVRDHGGEMRAENRPQGGAVFRIHLPAAVAQSVA
jgi:signal transduction histidine kinase